MCNVFLNFSFPAPILFSHPVLHSINQMNPSHLHFGALDDNMNLLILFAPTIVLLSSASSLQTGTWKAVTKIGKTCILLLKTIEAQSTCPYKYPDSGQIPARFRRFPGTGSTSKNICFIRLRNLARKLGKLYRCVDGPTFSLLCNTIF